MQRNPKRDADLARIDLESRKKLSPFPSASFRLVPLNGAESWQPDGNGNGR